MKLILHAFELPLRHPFTISRGTVSVQPTLIVELQQDGLSGYGEATTNDYYQVTFGSMQLSLEAVREKIESHTLTDPAEFWDALAGDLRHDPFAQCALDQAAHDLWGKQRGQPVYRLWGLSLAQVPVSNFTIGIDSIDRMLAKLRETPDWPVYKIKLGTPHDLDIIRALREETDAPFRVDANCGWQVEEAIENAAALQELGVEFIEQPLPADDWEGMQEVYRRSALPLVADESCVLEKDVPRCQGYFHGVNVKLVKCGGLTPARRMIDQAKGLGLKTMVGCMTESTVGISAIAQLLPLLDYVDMDGAALLEKDIADGVRVERGEAIFPAENGNGVRLR